MWSFTNVSEFEGHFPYDMLRCSPHNTDKGIFDCPYSGLEEYESYDVYITLVMALIALQYHEFCFWNKIP